MLSMLRSVLMASPGGCSWGTRPRRYRVRAGPTVLGQLGVQRVVDLDVELLEFVVADVRHHVRIDHRQVTRVSGGLDRGLDLLQPLAEVGLDVQVSAWRPYPAVLLGFRL